MIAPILAVAVVMTLLSLRARRKRRLARTDALLVSREDRTASFARGPRRFRQKGLL
ncbi:MAG TPA: hypothetical protein VHA79_01530 [Mycobacteriales bacterium]|jgi:hypothetical protein|nr:hypothetical protein [Mycobacteriales bacterium]